MRRPQRKFTRTRIASSAIKAFLERPRRDLRKLKNASDARLQERADELEIRPPLFKRLRREQRICFLIGAKYRYAAFMLDTGMGKTLLSCALIRYFNELGDTNSALVLVPNRANKTEWAREIEKHIDAGRLPEDFSYCILKGSSENKWQQLADSQDLVCVETYAGLARMVCSLVPSKKKKRNVLKPNPALVKKLCGLFDSLIMDESTLVGSSKSLPYRICRQLRKRATIAYTLTGTPFGRDPTMLWSQMFLVDQGQTLGETLGLFRAAFFNEKEDHFGHVTYTFDKRNEELLNRVLAHSSVQYEADESTLPALTHIKKYASLPADADQLYQIARKNLIEAKGSIRESKNAFLRMRQISSGFVGYHDDDEGRKAEYEFSFNPKREMLFSLLEAINPNYKRVVFVDFVFSGSMIGREMQKAGIPYAHLWGGTKDPDAERERFENDDDCRTLILNNQSGGFGLNLQIVKYGIYYEAPVSPIMRKQTRRRFERQGSEHTKVFLYDLLVRNTMDEAILKWHAEGEGLFDAIIRGKAKI